MSRCLSNMSALDRFFLACGILMAASELWKQWCITFLLNSGCYNWWYFPFQLCSVPMYVCLVLPWLGPGSLQDALRAFLMDFGLLGGIFAFCDTSGMHYGYAPLTVHSFAWHFLLIGIGLAAGLSFRGVSPRTRLRPDLRIRRASGLHACWRSYLPAARCYLCGCLLATLLNLSLSPLGHINMFYISPLEPMRQKFFSAAALSAGRMPAIGLYILASLFGALLLHSLWCLAAARRQPSP